ncbi:MOSC domain-containing protein [Ancylobacter sp. WKF20]|uniref:MOSC domain-containing protein n=1 Tax=Ancylobacter sp. WKF20 TaxID=3039801 RepID=UPI0024341FE9|nr:MOSC domain-containing protein [Ancylobacter sp. WKF20]WGD31809.1 MOSC domain-containing protein [Ancylobacter sp. WKF20]
MARRSAPVTAEGPVPDLFGATVVEAPAALPGRRLKARLARTLLADGRGFLTRDVAALDLTLDGITGDRHAGAARKADARVPWYPRGAPIRNTRQVSLVALDELAAVAARLGVVEIRPEWLGANLVVEGLARLTRLPVGTRLHFPGGAALVVEGENAPCRHAGQAVAEGIAEMGLALPAADLALAFVTAAKGLRGLVAWVERAGALEAGAEISVRVPAQQLWVP